MDYIKLIIYALDGFQSDFFELGLIRLFSQNSCRPFIIYMLNIVLSTLKSTGIQFLKLLFMCQEV